MRRTGLDTNVLVRYFVQEPAPDPATLRQSDSARRLMDGGQPLAVAKTVLLELEWVLRGFYDFKPAQVQRALTHLLALPQLEIECREQVLAALDLAREGFDFADALHHASYRACDQVASFDDRGFARRAARKNLAPRVVVPS